MIIRTAIIAAALSTTFAATTAQAESYKKQAVSYADLDLATAEGQETLDRRLTRAVKKLCDQGSDSTLGTMMVERKCRKQARASYQQQRQFAISAAKGQRAMAVNTLTIGVAGSPVSL